MKHYKILENRPELTNEQLVQGMDFNKIKLNASIAKKAILKSLLIKGVLGIVLVSSGIFIYKQVNHSPSENKLPKPVNTISSLHITVIDSPTNPTKKPVDTNTQTKIEEKKIAVISISKLNLQIDSSKIPINTTKVETPVMVNEEIPTGETKSSIDSVISPQKTANTIKSQKLSKVDRVKSCKIWDSEDFCNTPKTAKFASSFDCDVVEFDYVNCQMANKTDNVVAVWLTIETSENSTFQIENQLKNFVLVNSDNHKSQYPLMIKVSADNNFLGAHLKAKKIVAKYTKQVDIFLLFKSAKVGDMLTIKNFVEATIE